MLLKLAHQLILTCNECACYQQSSLHYSEADSIHILHDMGSHQHNNGCISVCFIVLATVYFVFHYQMLLTSHNITLRKGHMY